MYCPQCGQQQVSSDVRFCSRCGFQLSVVTNLLTTGGVAPSPTDEQPQAGESPRRRGARQGMTMFFVGIIVTIVFAILFGDSDGDVEKFPGILVPLSGVILILGGFLRTIFALLFEEGRRKRQPGAGEHGLTYTPPPAPERVADHTAAASLPPAQSIPARAYVPPTPRAQTGEVRLPPPSVTDSTTRLLKDTPDEQAR